MHHPAENDDGDVSTVRVFERTDLSALLRLLKDSNWGQRLTDEQRTELVRCARIRRYAAGERIYAEGEAGDTVSVVIQGTVEVRKTCDQRVYRQATLTRGQTFGESALLTDGRRGADVYALEPSQILMVCAAAPDAQWMTAVAVGMVSEIAARTRRTTHRAAMAAASHEAETVRRAEIARFLTLLIVCMSVYRPFERYVRSCACSRIRVGRARELWLGTMLGRGAIRLKCLQLALH
ncbi:MAG: cyclic nucleotide-binding domain-containing protein [Myxococcota bacterium]